MALETQNSQTRDCYVEKSTIKRLLHIMEQRLRLIFRVPLVLQVALKVQKTLLDG